MAGTFRDDIAKVGRRLMETVEERTGREVITSEERQLLESDRSERRRLEKTLDFIGFSLFNYDGGTPTTRRCRSTWTRRGTTRRTSGC
jgi:hypothetical protein